jgi:hypothetical protein
VKIFYDTEFRADGHAITPISIGMVAEDGRELYYVFEEVGTGEIKREICKDAWLMKNVIPHLPMAHGLPPVQPSSGCPGGFALDLDSNVIMPTRMIRNAVRQFILDTLDPELWAYYGAYDHVLLAQLFGRMIDLPRGVPMFTCDLMQLLSQRRGEGFDVTPPPPAKEHHALADAQWNMLFYQRLTGGEVPSPPPGADKDVS